MYLNRHAFVMDAHCVFLKTEMFSVRKNNLFNILKTFRIPINTVELQWLEHRWLVYHGLFELIFDSLRNVSDSSRSQILREILLFYYEIVLCVLIRIASSKRFK